MEHKCEITFEELTDYSSGRANTELSLRIEAHMKTGCFRCQKESDWLVLLMQDMKVSGRIVMPEFPLEPARQLFREKRRQSEQAPLFARLVFDSRMSPAAVGVREVARQTFTQIHSTYQHDIELWCEPSQTANWYLIGQALSRSAGASHLESAILQAQDGQTFEAKLDGGEFHFPQVPNMPCSIRLRLEGEEILISDILGASVRSADVIS